MQLLNGMMVIESPYIAEVPTLQLSPNFNSCSDAVKQSVNAWLLEIFGTYTPVYVIGDTVCMHPKHIAMLKTSLVEGD